MISVEETPTRLDVLVAGGGIAGLMAAISAASNGATMSWLQKRPTPSEVVPAPLATITFAATYPRSMAAIWNRFFHGPSYQNSEEGTNFMPKKREKLVIIATHAEESPDKATLDAGGKLMVCSPCMQARKIQREDLIAQSTVIAGATLVSEILSASSVVTY